MAVKNLKDFITVGHAAEFLGVSPSTLRNWDRAGKLKAIKQPISGYRLYRKSDLEQFLRNLERPK
ncbi:MAG: helix-turn-helix domain-containing protein [Elusimicrobia bacterium]|nr:helix-turn-helix domain-containing protein [Elusimicrobiota bacterium]